jgi:type III restriction enzyme
LSFLVTTINKKLSGQAGITTPPTTIDSYTQALQQIKAKNVTEQLDRHYVIGLQGPTGEIRDGRRVSESFIPIAVTKKGKKGQDDSEQFGIDFDITGERRQKNDLIKRIRLDVDTWLMGGHYGGVAPITRKLLQHWADPNRENRVIFAQREAAETAIFLTEVAGRHHGYADWRKRLEPENEAHDDGLPRAALKVATGVGKTVVMAMLIAWHTLNKVQSPRDARFTNRFLVVTPGATIRDRLRVLLPEDPANYYELRDLIPSDLKGGCGTRANHDHEHHAFQLQDPPSSNLLGPLDRAALVPYICTERRFEDGCDCPTGVPAAGREQGQDGARR